MHVFTLFLRRLLRVGPVRGLVAAAFIALAATVAHAQVRVAVRAAYQPSTTTGHSLAIDLAQGSRIFAEANANGVPTHEAGFFRVDEGGAGFQVTISGKNVRNGRVDFYVSDRWDEYVLLVDGQQGGHVFVSPNDDEKTVTITILSKTRLKTQLGSGGADSLLGTCTSPYYQPLSVIEDGLMMDVNLGLTENGQSLPPLRLGYLGGYTLPSHPDIVPDSGNAANVFPKKYKLPQARLKIDSHAGFLSISLAAPDDESHPYVQYTFTDSQVSLTVPDPLGGAPSHQPSWGYNVTWTREVYDISTEPNPDNRTAILVRTDISTGPRLTSSGLDADAKPSEDWHEQSGAAVRKFKFLRLGAPDFARELITTNANGDEIAHTRMEAQQWEYEVLDPTSEVEDPRMMTLVDATPKKFIVGFGSTHPLTTEQILTTSLELRGTKRPDGAVTQTISNLYFNEATQTTPTGEPATTRRVAETWKNSSPIGFLDPVNTPPSTLLVSEYEYAADWTGLKTLPSRVLTTAEGKTLHDETIAYAMDSSVAVSGLTQAQKVFTATRTLYDTPKKIRSLTAVSKKFQGNTPNLFYSDLFYSLQEADGTKRSYAYQRGTAGTDGSFTEVTDPDASTTAISGLKTIVLTGIKGEPPDPATPTLTSSSFPGAKFDFLTLMPQKSTASVEIRRYGLPVRVETWVCSTGTTFELVAWENREYTPYGGLVKVTTSRGTTATATWSGQRKDHEIDAAGQRTDYAYDIAGRVKSITREAVDLVDLGATIPVQRTAFDYDAEGRLTQLTVGPEIGEHLVTSYEYNLAGELKKKTNPDGTTVDYLSTNSVSGSSLEITTNKGTDAEAKTVINRYVDGRLQSVTGNASVNEFHSYDYETRGTGTDSFDLPRETVFIGSSDGTLNTARFQTTVRDWYGRAIEQRAPSLPDSTSVLVREMAYDDNGRLQSTVTVERTGTTDKPVSAKSLMQYDSFGQVTAAGLKLESETDPNAPLKAAGADRFAEITGQATKYGTDWWAEGTTRTYETSAATSGVSSSSSSRLTGFSGGAIAETQSVDSENNPTTTLAYLDTIRKIRTDKTQLADGSAVHTDYAGGFPIRTRTFASGVTPSDTNHSAVSSYQYDSLGRLTSSTDPRGIVTSTQYEQNKARALYVFSGVNASGTPIRVATYEYDNAGRVKKVTDAKNNETNFSYDTQNRVVDEWGAGTQPLHHVYHAVYGYQTELWTDRSAASGAKVGTTAPDKTVWAYDDATGLLTKKTDAAGKFVRYAYSYDFTAQEKLIKRINARTVTRTDHYNLLTGDLTDVTYDDDGATQPLHYTYTRSGRIATVRDATWDAAHPDDVRRFTYVNGRLQAEFLTAYFANRVLTTNYEPSSPAATYSVTGRYRGFQLGYAANPATAVSGDASEMSINFTYDALGRLKDLQAAYPGYTGTATYSYTGGTGHWEKLTHGEYRLNRVLEAGRNLVSSVSATYGSGTALSVKAAYAYGYDARDMLESVVQSGAAWDDFVDPTFTKFTNDEAGRLTKAESYLGSDVATTTRPLPGRGLQFVYDSAGNRKQVKVDTETVSYKDAAAYAGNEGANNLNQVMSRHTLKSHVSGTVQFTSSATPTVTVNDLATNRQDAYWDLGIDPTTNGQPAVAVNVKATQGAQSQQWPALTALIRPQTESFAYDLDGNLTGDSMWDYTWDAENRLKQMTTKPWVVPARAVSFTYDYLGRRVRKRVEITGQPTIDRKFVYEGWNLVAEFDTGAASSLARSYVWGLDVSNSLDGAGGVGGLVLAVTHSGSAVTVRDVAVDGNGNVVALVNPADGALTAKYEYDAFGQLYRLAGSEAAANPIRFSTKYCDVETGLTYYGFRYYDASLGRFISRDPLEEAGGTNLYGFVNNNPVNGWDYLGLQEGGGLDLPVFSGYWPNGDALGAQALGSLNTNDQRSATGPGVQVPVQTKPEKTIADTFNGPNRGVNDTDVVIGLVAGSASKIAPPPVQLGTFVFIAGFGAGQGYDKMPTLWGGEKLSDYWGDAIDQFPTIWPFHGKRISDYVADARVPVPPATQTAMPPPRPPTTKQAPPGFPGDDPHEHHRLPRQFKENFEKAGLNIENFKTTVPEQWHTGQGIGLHPQGFNPAWEEFFAQNPNANAQQILDFLNKLETSLGFGTVPPATPPAPPPGTVSP